jgi:hypothetical protein
MPERFSRRVGSSVGSRILRDAGIYDLQIRIGGGSNVTAYRDRLIAGEHDAKASSSPKASAKPKAKAKAKPAAK